MESLLTVGGTLVAVIFLATAGYFIIKGQRITGKNDASVAAVTMMTGQIAALTSAQELANQEINHLKDSLAEKDRLLERNARDIKQLQEALTQRAEVDEFRKESRAWFTAIAKVTGAEPPRHVGHN